MKNCSGKSLFGSLLAIAVVLFVMGYSASADNMAVAISATRGTEEDKVIVRWDRIKDATGYKVLKASNYSGPYLPVACKDVGEELYVDTDVTIGKYYWYKVRPRYHLISGDATRRVQGWITPRVPGGIVSIAERIPAIISQVPHFHNVRGLAEKRYETLPEPEIEGEYMPDNNEIFGWVEQMCANDHRRIGSPESLQAIEKLKGWLADIIGAQGAVYEESFPLDAVYTAEEWGLEIHNGTGYDHFPAFYAVNTGMTLKNPYNPHGGTVEGNMIWVDDGSPEAFSKIEENGGTVAGKIVVANCRFPDLPVGLIDFLFDGGYAKSDPEGWINITTTVPMGFVRSNFPAEYLDTDRFEDSVYWQAHSRGAVGIVLVMENHPGDINTHWGPYDGRMRPIPCLWVSSYRGDEIKAIAEKGTVARVTIKGRVAPGEGHNVYAVLPATEYLDAENGIKTKETILISTHHDTCFKGATEDGTGIAMVLSQARYWTRVEKREKNILFVFTDGHHYRGIGAEMFAHEHLDGYMKNTIININLEHLAAKRVEEDADGKLIPLNSGAFTIMFINENPTAIAASKRMLETARTPRGTGIDRTIAFQSTLLGAVPPGEAGHFHIVAGTDFIHWIGSPVYLLTGEDTLDKVDKELLEPLATAAAELVGTFMRLPEGYSDYE